MSVNNRQTRRGNVRRVAREMPGALAIVTGMAIAAISTSACKSVAASSSPPGQDAAVGVGKTCQGLPPLPQKQSYTIGFVQVLDPGNPWTESNSADMITRAESRGHKLVLHSPQVSGPQGQIAAMQDLIDARVDAIVLRPVDTTSLVPSVLAARNACIPVFTVNRSLDSERAIAGKDYVTGLSADYVAQGRLIADWLVTATGGRAAVLEIEGPPGASSSIGRKKGFEERIAREPGMRLVASKPANYERTKGHDVARELLEGCPRCTVIYAHNDNMALGALAAVRELGKAPGKDVMIVGVDGLKEAIQDVIEGTMGATVLNSPRMGAITFATIEKYGSGQHIEPAVIVKGPLIDRSNAAAMIGEAI
jgi:ribose transport system substrate-binding protein